MTKKGKYPGEWRKNWRKKIIKGSYEKKEVIGDISYLRKRVQLALKWHLFYSVKAYILCFFFWKELQRQGKFSMTGGRDTYHLC